MKNPKCLFTVLLYTLITFLIPGCGDDSPASSSKPDLDAVENITILQDEVDMLAESLLNSGLDTMEVKDSLAAIFKAQKDVESVITNELGVMVQYKNGLRGGIMLDPLDGYGPEPPDNQKTFKDSQDKIQGKPGSKKTIFINPSYWERTPQANKISYPADEAFSKAGMEEFDYYINEDCTVDRFLTLSGYGVVHIYTHGLPWPSKDDIEEVYIYTGEEVNNATTTKYWKYAKTGDLIFVNYRNKNIYCISPRIFAAYNDFSKDTTLYYGGYCFSFLGSWKETIVDDLGAGAYIGFDWAVQTGWNAAWSIDMYKILGDTNYSEPLNLQYWYDHINQNYQSEKWNKYVTVNYYGDGAMTLWGGLDIKISPSSFNGFTGMDYTFYAEVKGADADEIKYEWDFGDGSSKTNVADNSVSHKWSDIGTYTITLRVYDNANGRLIGQVTTTATVKEQGEDLLSKLQENNLVSQHLFVKMINSLDYSWGSILLGNPWGEEAKVQWSGTSFSVNYKYTIGGGMYMDSIVITGSVNGSMSDDGLTVLSCSGSQTNETWELGEITQVSDAGFSVSNLQKEYPDKDDSFTYVAKESSASSHASGINYLVKFYEEGSETSRHTLKSVEWDDPNTEPLVKVMFENYE